MAEYKLIKDFPMCPLEVGAIVTEDKLGQYVSEDVIIFEKEIIENYPEFWQKVEEVDYEILSFNCKAKDITSDGAYLWNSTFNEWFHCKDDLDSIIKKYGIKSVKRLSDGEVFTIGDTIANMCNSEQKITELYIHKDDKKMCVYTSTTCRFTIDNINKVKTPLFTTEDGVEVFDKKTSYYLVSNDFKVCFSSWFSQADLPFKTFSTKEKAEEYIINNKPCLSFNDIVNDIIDPNSLRAIKETIKNKLQL